VIKVLALDLDGVLYKWHVAVYEYYRLYKNYQGCHDAFWTTFYKTISEEEWTFITNIDFLYACIAPDKDCRDFLDTVKEKFTIYYITSRPLYVKTTTEQFLNRYNFPFCENLVFTDDKVNTARRLQVDYFLEDLPANAKALSAVTRVIMIEQPYNKEHREGYGTSQTLMGTLQYLED
jgi:uncharacterized HAD superfamily protein